MYLTQREKLEDLEQFKKAAEEVVDRARQEPEYRKEFLRAIGLGDSLVQPDSKPKKPKRSAQASPKKKDVNPTLAQ